MELLLPKTLTGWEPVNKSEKQTSEIRGGKYAARIQIGYEKDGSPKYRYFKTQEEYEKYLQGRGGKKKKKKDKDKRKDGDTLEEKREKEQKESKEKQQKLMTASAKKKKEVETTKKSLCLYLEVNNE